MKFESKRYTILFQQIAHPLGRLSDLGDVVAQGESYRGRTAELDVILANHKLTADSSEELVRSVLVRTPYRDSAVIRLVYDIMPD